MGKPGRVRIVSAFETKLERYRSYIDARDGKLDTRFYGVNLYTTTYPTPPKLLPIPTTLAMCIAHEQRKSKGRPSSPPRVRVTLKRTVTIDCKRTAQMLGKLIAIDKQLPVARYVYKWSYTLRLGDAARLRAQKKLNARPPTKEEFYADQLIRAVTVAILLGAVTLSPARASAVAPKITYMNMIDALDNRFPTAIPKICIAVRKAHKTFRLPALKTLVVTTGAEAKKLFRAILKKHRPLKSP